MLKTNRNTNQDLNLGVTRTVTADFAASTVTGCDANGVPGPIAERMFTNRVLV